MQELENNPKVIRSDYRYIDPNVPKDAVDLLKEGPVTPSSISAVICSHLHFDHTGDCTKFPDAEIIVGPGSHAATFPGWPAALNSPFGSDILEHPHFRELSFEKESWAPFRKFPRAHNFFGDGSFYLVDTPGHMPGHLAAIARTGNDEWVFMGGDCCHHRALLMGHRPISITVGPGIAPSFHSDPVTASETIVKVRLLEESGNVLVALAHDAILEGRMPEYPKRLNGWRGSSWKEELDEVLGKQYPRATSSRNH